MSAVPNPRGSGKGRHEGMVITPELIGFAIISILLIAISVFGARWK